MRGPKLNEGATIVGERSGTKAVAKYVRSSAYKARVVLDHIRGLDVISADQVLQLIERGIATDIRKVLASAVANATTPENGAYIGDAEELFVIACFADEGPTLRRFRPRARGRATRIRKRTCHITVIVARMSDERLEILQARSEGASANAAVSRRQRVERSRERAAAAAADVDATDETEEHDDLDAETTEDSAGTEVTVAEDTAADAESADSTTEPATPAPSEGDTDVAAADVTAGDFEAGEWDGSVLPDADGNGPASHPIKGNADSMLYHTPDSRYYKITKAEVWFDTEANAAAAGFSKPGTNTDEDDK